MKIRTAKKIMKHQPEIFMDYKKFNKYWVQKWNNYESYPPLKPGHRIDKAITLTNKKNRKNEQKEK